MRTNSLSKMDRVLKLLGELVDAVANRPPSDGPRRLLGRIAAAAYLSVSPRMLDYARAQGDVPAVLIGGRVLFDVADLDALCQRRKERGGPSDAQ